MFVKLTRRRKDNATMLTKTASMFCQLATTHYFTLQPVCLILQVLPVGKSYQFKEQDYNKDFYYRWHTICLSVCTDSSNAQMCIVFNMEIRTANQFYFQNHDTLQHTHTQNQNNLKYPPPQKKTRRKQNWVRVDIVYYLSVFYDM